jgi:hypothetical protein
MRVHDEYADRIRSYPDVHVHSRRLQPAFPRHQGQLDSGHRSGKPQWHYHGERRLHGHNGSGGSRPGWCCRPPPPAGLDRLERYRAIAGGSRTDDSGQFRPGLGSPARERGHCGGIEECRNRAASRPRSERWHGSPALFGSEQTERLALSRYGGHPPPGESTAGSSYVCRMYGRSARLRTRVGLPPSSVAVRLVCDAPDPQKPKGVFVRPWPFAGSRFEKTNRGTLSATPPAPRNRIDGSARRAYRCRR